MNFTPGRSGVSNLQHLVEQARDEGREVLASKGESDRQCPIIRRSRDSFPYCQASFAKFARRCTTSPSSLHNFLFFAGGSSLGSSRNNSKISEFHDIVRLVESISINST